MILPIVAYGDPVLKSECDDIDKDFEGLEQLIADMFETMYNANGIGLAAPQIDENIRLFIVDGSPFEDDEELEEKEREILTNFKKIFINPEIVEEKGKKWAFKEGCLSIPDIREDVMREPEITIEYYDENFKFKSEKFDGIAARIIQHEYDHIEGILFTDNISSLKRRLLKGKLRDISMGNIEAKYKMKFPLRKK
ncbi:MAG: peptide deformylase [Patiriisocius sp.]|jgi:peptide deformylase